MLKRKSKLPNLNKNIEIILEQSIKGLFPNSKYKIVWKSCDEIFGKKGKKKFSYTT